MIKAVFYGLSKTIDSNISVVCARLDVGEHYIGGLSVFLRSLTSFRSLPILPCAVVRVSLCCMGPAREHQVEFLETKFTNTCVARREDKEQQVRQGGIGKDAQADNSGIETEKAR